MRSSAFLSVILGLLIASGCLGSIGDGETEPASGQVPGGENRMPSGMSGGRDPAAPVKPGGATPPVFSCDRAQAPDELPLPRLSRTELGNTLRFAIKLAVPNDATAIWN